MKSKKYIYKRHTTDFKISNVFLNYLKSNEKMSRREALKSFTLKYKLTENSHIWDYLDFFDLVEKDRKEVKISSRGKKWIHGDSLTRQALLLTTKLDGGYPVISLCIIARTFKLNKEKMLLIFSDIVKDFSYKEIKIYEQKIMKFDIDEINKEELISLNQELNYFIGILKNLNLIKEVDKNYYCEIFDNIIDIIYQNKLDLSENNGIENDQIYDSLIKMIKEQEFCLNNVRNDIYKKYDEKCIVCGKNEELRVALLSNEELLDRNESSSYFLFCKEHLDSYKKGEFIINGDGFIKDLAQNKKNSKFCTVNNVLFNSVALRKKEI